MIFAIIAGSLYISSAILKTKKIEPHSTAADIAATIWAIIAVLNHILD